MIASSKTALLTPCGMPNFAPSGRAMPCTSATELLVKGNARLQRTKQALAPGFGIVRAGERTGRNRASLPAARKEKSMVV